MAFLCVTNPNTDAAPCMPALLADPDMPAALLSAAAEGGDSLRDAQVPTVESRTKPSKPTISFVTDELDGIPTGVHLHVQIQELEEGLACVTQYNAPYGSVTAVKDLAAFPARDSPYKFVLMAAKDRIDSDVYSLAAIGHYEEVFTQTMCNACARLDRDVWWYFRPGIAIGFAASSDVLLNKVGDSISLDQEDAQQRLSWTLDGVNGGYRAGLSVNLAEDSKQRKVFKYCNIRANPLQPAAQAEMGIPSSPHLPLIVPPLQCPPQRTPTARTPSLPPSRSTRHPQTAPPSPTIPAPDSLPPSTSAFSSAPSPFDLLASDVLALAPLPAPLPMSYETMPPLSAPELMPLPPTPPSEKGDFEGRRDAAVMSGSLIAVVSGAIGAALVLLCVLASAWCQRRRQGLQARRIMSMVAETSPSPDERELSSVIAKALSENPHLLAAAFEEHSKQLVELQRPHSRTQQVHAPYTDI